MQKTMAVILMVFGILVMPQLGHAFTVDGNMSDWGVTPGLLNASDWIPNSGINYSEEDGDGVGGQLYDAEAMYTSSDSTNLYYAIVTGHPSSGVGLYKPGDIAFDFNFDETYEYGIETTGDGHIVGGLYSVQTWNTGTVYNKTSPTGMNTVNGLLGTGSLVYNNAYYGTSQKGSHYVIEGSIPRSYFGNSNLDNGYMMSWAMTCGNDVIKLKVPPTHNPVPEPATMTLLGIGMAGLGFARRRKFSA